MKLCVLSAILLSCFAFYNASTIRPTRTISVISNKNPCDVYLIVNFLIFLHKHGVTEHNLSTSEQTPLGLLSSQIEIQKVNDLSFIWNPRTAKVIFIILTTQLDSLYADVLMTFTMNSVDFEVLLNELIGVNNIPVSQKSIEIFKYLAQMFATALGVKTPPFALLNLYGLIIILTSLAGKDCGTTTFSPIGELATVTDNKLLAKEIAKCSLIIDAATYYNSKFQFSNCACLLHTCSGYATRPLIGHLKLAESLEIAISGLLNIYTNAEIFYILIKVLMEHVAYCDVGEPLSYIFQDQNLVGKKFDDTTEVLLLENVETEDTEKCSKAPEIEEIVTTVTSFLAEIQNSTEKVEFVEEPETATEEVTTKKPRIFVDTTPEELTTPIATTFKTDAPTTTTTTDAPTTTTTTDAPTTTTTTDAPTTTITTDAPTTTTTTPSPTTTESATTTSSTTEPPTEQPVEIPTPVDSAPIES